jgi:hypothetical protein
MMDVSDNDLRQPCAEAQHGEPACAQEHFGRPAAFSTSQLADDHGLGILFHGGISASRCGPFGR